MISTPIEEKHNSLIFITLCTCSRNNIAETLKIIIFIKECNIFPPKCIPPFKNHLRRFLADEAV